MSAVTLDFSKAQPLPAAPVTLDFSKAVPIGTDVNTTPDTRNGVQKFVDNLTTVTPEQEAGHSALVNRMQEFGAGAIQGATAPFVHPLNTLAAVGNTIAHPINTGKQVVQSAVANPAQFAGNLVGGAVLGEAAAPIGEAAANLAGKTTARAALLGKTPEAAYESALKPSTTIGQADRANLVQTGLQNAIPVSKGGASRLSNLIDDYNTKTQAAIDANPNQPISTVPAIRNLDSVRAKFANQVTPQPDMADINQVQQNFLNNPKVQAPGAGPGPSSIPAADAQAMKQGTYQALGSKAYGEVKGASIEAQKALARGLKDEIANQFPEIAANNAANSKLLDLQPVIERALNRGGNHQLIGIGTPVTGAAAEAVTGSSGVGAVAGVLKAVLDNPAVKSRLAIAVSKGGGIPYTQALGRVGAYSTALGSSALDSQGYSADAAPSQ